MFPVESIWGQHWEVGVETTQSSASFLRPGLTLPESRLFVLFVRWK